MRWSSERGATLIHVGISLMGLLLLSGFVVDYGVFWVARRQAQNAADAGALSGAMARILNDTSPSPSTTSGPVYSSIVNAVAFNPIWGQSPPPATVDIGWVCPDGTTNCVRADVYRDGSHSSTSLPTFFMKMGSVQSQGTKAHAVAQIVPANGAGCMRPWFIIDHYTDVNADGMYTSPPDLYDGNPADAGTSAYTGYQVPQDLGRTVLFHANLSPSGYGQVDVGSGGNAINNAIENCVGLSPTTYQVGQVVPVKPGSTNGPESQGVNQLIAWDPNATVDLTTNAVVNSCAPTCSCPGNVNSLCPNGPTISPRVAIVPVCAPTEAGCATGGQSNNTITIKEFLSFFIVGASGNGNNLDITAILVGSAGSVVPMGGGTPVGSVPPSGSFLKAVVLIR